MDQHPTKNRSSGIRLLDTGLMVAAVIGGVLVVLWLVHVVLGVALFIFKVAILVIVVAVIVRLIHHLTRSSS